MDALWGHDKAGVGFAWQILGLAHNAPLARPAIEGAIGEVAKAPRRLPALLTGRLRLCHFSNDVRLETIILCQPKTKST